MPRDIANYTYDTRFASLDSGLLAHTVQDEESGEHYTFFGTSVRETRQQLAAFMKEWADRGTGRHEEEA